MKVMVYNIRYGTGRRQKHAWMDQLRRTDRHSPHIAKFIKSQAPDVVGVVEVDYGSFRNRGGNQVDDIAKALGSQCHCYDVKYRKHGFLHALPVFRCQGNALITRKAWIGERFHYFQDGMKPLVIEVEFEHVRFFLVHMSLRFWVRYKQLIDLHDFVMESEKPCVVMGDFNVLSGHREMELFLKATKLMSVNTGHLATYPSWSPKKELDFICYSKGLKLKSCHIPNIALSDHFPVIADFEIL